MPRRPRPVPEVVALLETWLALAKAGEIAEVFVLAKAPRGEWADSYWFFDPDDMAFELRSAAIRVGNEPASSGGGHAAT